MSESKPPFFLLGCAWSGIAAISNALKLHPNLVGPSPTSFYRWTQPFGSRAFEQSYLTTNVLKKNWLKDGFSAQDMTQVFAQSQHRQSLSHQYANAFLQKQGLSGKRWFDATPENVYGLLLLRSHFSQSKFVHIYANPVNVVASLMFSPSASSVTLLEAVNRWFETMQIIQSYKLIQHNNLIELRYEDFEQDAETAMHFLLNALEEDAKSYDFARLRSREQQTSKVAQRKKQGYAAALSAEDTAFILDTCEYFIKHYQIDVSEAKQKVAAARKSATDSEEALDQLFDR